MQETIKGISLVAEVFSRHWVVLTESKGMVGGGVGRELVEEVHRFFKNRENKSSQEFQSYNKYKPKELKKSSSIRYNKNSKTKTREGINKTIAHKDTLTSKKS